MEEGKKLRIPAEEQRNLSDKGLWLTEERVKNYLGETKELNE